MKDIKSVWILSDQHKIGSHTQCYGVASAFGWDPVMHKIIPRFPWSVLPPQGWFFPLKGIVPRLLPPWPDVIIASGRAAVAPTIHIAKKSGALTICILDPCVNLKHFDVVIAPEHDRISGPNVIPVFGAIHPLTLVRLSNAGQMWRPQFAHLPKPWTGILLGGDNQYHRSSFADIDPLVQALQAWHKIEGGSLLITPSRRTRPEILNYFRQKLAASEFKISHFIWSGTGENPYQGILSLADRLVVTGDSVSMMSEACFTGKPVHVLDLGIQKRKFREFMTQLVRRNYARILKPTIESWPVQSLDEMGRIKPILQQFL